MAQNADNINVVRPKTAGAAYVGGDTASVPTSASETATGFESLGWISEDGITMTIDRTTEKLKGFGGDVALVITSEHSVSFKFTPMELNELTAKGMFGAGNVTASGGKVSAIKVNSDELDEFHMMLDLCGTNGRLVRVVVPCAKVSAIGELAMKHNAAMAAEWTVEALPDADGNKAYIYCADAA